jgi:hypothetical protein
MVHPQDFRDHNPESPSFNDKADVIFHITPGKNLRCIRGKVRRTSDPDQVNGKHFADEPLGYDLPIESDRKVQIDRIKVETHLFVG